MIKMILALIVFSLSVFLVIESVKILDNKQRWVLTKKIGYVTLCLAIAVVLLGSIVVLF